MADPLTGAVNTTLNSTLNETVAAAPSASEFVPLVFERLWELIIAPFRHPEMLWIIFPLAFTLLVMEFYFDRHRDEELGWAAAVANSLVLLIIALDLLKHSFHYASPGVVFKEILLAALGEHPLPLAPQVLILILLLAALGIGITIINYYHLMPKRWAFIISNHPPINYLAYFAIAIVYSTGTGHEIPFDMATLVAGGILFVVIMVSVLAFRRSMERMEKERNRIF